mmetsp:Transcript_52702/g.163701  ORF Transcript_52702/g.163701 Transcript_52702/m.163701 type:complete len:651 (-) Transcript_52702:114-2066(-)
MTTTAASSSRSLTVGALEAKLEGTGDEGSSSDEAGDTEGLCVLEPRQQRALNTGGLLPGDVFQLRRFGVPAWRAGLCAALELLFCLFLSHASGRADADRLPAAGATRWIAGGAWACLLLSLALRAALLAAWQARALGDGPLSALYMLSSSLQFSVYVSLQYAMYSATSEVSVVPEAFIDRADGNCTRDYAPPPACDGAAEAYRSPHTCCLVYRHTLRRPSQELVRPLGDLLAWASVPAVALIWKGAPLVPASPESTAFMSTLLLDMLDAMAFSGFLEDDRATYPALGIDLETTRSRQKDRKLLGLIWLLWVSAFATALLSRGLYAALRFSLAPQMKLGGRTLADIVADLLRSVRLLDETRARTLAGEAVRAQGESYRDADSDEDGTPVLVDAPMPSASWTWVGANPYVGARGRRGWADMVRPGEYNVEFVDGFRPSRLTLPVDRLEPDFAEWQHVLGPASCRGWGDPSYLSRGAPLERFDRWAKVLDAVRSLLCLELPFLAVRCALEVAARGRCSVWLLKNLVCIAVDVMMLAACGNEGAECLATRPLRFVSELVSVAPPRGIGPWAGGLHRVAADPAASSVHTRYQQDIERLSQHRAWLTLESEKAEAQAAELGTEEAVLAARVPYEASLRQVDLELARVNCQMQIPSE